MCRGQGIVVDAEKVLWKIVEVRDWVVGKRNPFYIVEIEPLFRDVERNVRPKEPYRHEERLVEKGGS